MATPELTEVIRYSPFVRRSLKAMLPMGEDGEREALFEKLCAGPWTAEAIRAKLTGISDADALGLALRKLRREIVVGLVGRNASGRCGYDEVVSVMTSFAEAAVSTMTSVQSRLLAARHGVPYGESSGKPQDLLVVGMGKLGGAELNVSSDIDLVFLYGEDGETRATAEYPQASRFLSNAEFFSRLAKRIIPALNEIEGPGFVFRVDMRLRPNGDAGPIVCSNDMLEEYLYSQGRDWERFAWLKGRIVNEPVFTDPECFATQSGEVRSLVRPFVFRKYLDFGAISSLTKLHEMIRLETDRREQIRAREGVNVKLGRGGIREIEFIVQTLQVIRGGRDPALRGRSTLPMLDALAANGGIASETAQALKRHYVFLRNVEHALQYVDDQQTQWLPRSGDALESAAALLGQSPEALWSEVESVREYVAKAFDSIFKVNEAKSETDEHAWPVGWASGTSSAKALLAKKLGDLGYDAADLDEYVARICALVSGRFASMVSEEARTRMRKLVQFVCEKVPDWRTGGQTRMVSSDELLSRYLRLLEAIAGRSTYVALLYQYPSAAERVGRVLAASRWSADYIVRHPIVLDELVDARNVEMDDFTPVDWSRWQERLRMSLEQTDGDQERQMNILRDMHHVAVFRLLVADLDGRFTVERLADQLSALADAAIAQVLELAWQTIVKDPENHPQFAVIGYGKLGGKELAYASDLDLVFLYDDDKPEASVNYSRLVRRMMSWLTVQTSSGKLFDVDLRLRPNGENGLAVCPFEMFCRYQENADGNGAWVWEHQALTRARFVAGDAELGRRFEAEREKILSMPRDEAALRSEIIKMRAKMLEGHRNRTKFFDIKHDRGGMVDVEFVVQFLVLAHASKEPALLNNFGNILLLEMSARSGFISQATAEKAVKAYRRYRALQHEIRLNAGEGAPARVPPSIVEGERLAVEQLWREVFDTDAPQRAETS